MKKILLNLSILTISLMANDAIGVLELKDYTDRKIPIVLDKNTVITNSKIDNNDLILILLVNKKFEYLNDKNLEKYKEIMSNNLKMASCQSIFKGDIKEEVSLNFKLKTIDNELFNVKISKKDCKNIGK